MKTEVDCIVIIPGGAGSTFVLQFLSQYLRANGSNSRQDGIKHIHSPRDPVLDLYDVKRAVYLFDDPQRTVRPAPCSAASFIQHPGSIKTTSALSGMPARTGTPSGRSRRT